MKEKETSAQEYVRQVERKLHVSRKQKQDILRDLEEIFASASEHGEPAEQVMERLGSPEEYANSMESQFAPSGKPFHKAILGLILSCCVAVLCFTVFVVSQEFRVPENAIGFAQGTTGIQVVGGFDLSPLLLVLGTVGLLCVVWFAWRLYRFRKG